MSVFSSSDSLTVYNTIKTGVLDNYFPLIACTDSTSGAAYGLKPSYCYTFVDFFTVTIGGSSSYIALYRDNTGKRTYNGMHKDLMNPNKLTTRQYITDGYLDYKSYINYDTLTKVDED